MARACGPRQVEQVGHNFFIFRDLESSQVQPHHGHGLLLLLQWRRGCDVDVCGTVCERRQRPGCGMLRCIGHALGCTRAWPAEGEAVHVCK